MTPEETTNICPGCGAADCTPATCPAYVDWHRARRRIGLLPPWAFQGRDAIRRLFNEEATT